MTKPLSILSALFLFAAFCGTMAFLRAKARPVKAGNVVDFPDIVNGQEMHYL